jgi:hypothetical protein
LTFPSGFKAVLIGSAGPITPGVRALAEKLGPVDIAIVAYQVHAVADTQIKYTWPIVELFKPKLFLPAHHDAAPPAWVDVGLEPLFDKIRAEMPGTKFLAPLYRSRICVAAAGPDKGNIVSFKYYTQSLKARLSLFTEADESDSWRTMEVRDVSTDTVAPGF